MEDRDSMGSDPSVIWKERRWTEGEGDSYMYSTEKERP